MIVGNNRCRRNAECLLKCTIHNLGMARDGVHKIGGKQLLPAISTASHAVCIQRQATGTGSGTCSPAPDTARSSALGGAAFQVHVGRLRLCSIAEGALAVTHAHASGPTAVRMRRAGMRLRLHAILALGAAQAKTFGRSAPLRRPATVWAGRCARMGRRVVRR